MGSLLAAGTLLSIGGLGLYLYQANGKEEGEETMEKPIKMEEPVKMEETTVEEKQKPKTRTNRRRQRGITRKRY